MDDYIYAIGVFGSELATVCLIPLGGGGVSWAQTD